MYKNINKKYKYLVFNTKELIIIDFIKGYLEKINTK